MVLLNPRKSVLSKYGETSDMINWLYPLKHRLDERGKRNFFWAEFLSFGGIHNNKRFNGELLIQEKKTRHYNASPQSSILINKSKRLNYIFSL